MLYNTDIYWEKTKRTLPTVHSFAIDFKKNIYKNNKNNTLVLITIILF